MAHDSLAHDSFSLDETRCFFTGERMHAWRTVPRDWRRPDRPQHFQIWRAPCSQFAWILPRPTDAEIASFYEAPDYYTHGDDAPPLVDNVALRVLRRAAWSLDHSVVLDDHWLAALLGPPKQRVLEIGAGHGVVLALAQGLGHDCIGVEPDAAAMEVARRAGLDVVQGTAEMLPASIASQRFDAVLMIHVLEHVRDPARALLNAASLLAPGGKLVVETPNNACVGAERSRFAWAFCDAPRHLSFFTPASLRAAVSWTGLRIERSELVGFTRQFKRDWIDIERRAWEALDREGPRPSAWRATSLLLEALWKRPEQRYDSVRIVATL